MNRVSIVQDSGAGMHQDGVSRLTVAVSPTFYMAAEVHRG